MPLHGSCAAYDGEAVLLLGPPGSGKSDLVLRLIGRGWRLVADDQVEITAGPEGLVASAPRALAGMLEVRGLGIFRDLPALEQAPLRLVLDLWPANEKLARLPEPRRFEALGHTLPRTALHALEASAPERVAFALAAARGEMKQVAGAFAT